MKDVRRDILEDAIQTSIEYSIENMRLKRVILVMGIVILMLIAGYVFVR